MQYLIDKSGLVVGATASAFFVVLALATPHAMADEASTRALEQKIQQLEMQLRSIRNELDQVKSEAIHKQEITEQRERATTAVPEEKVTTTVPEQKKTTIVQDRLDHKHHMLFFRGGFTHAMQRRPGTSIQSNVAPVGAQDLADRDGWYVGAGFDFSLTNNVWGLLPRTEVMSELMFEYKEFADNVKGNALANNPTQLAGGAFNPRNVTVTQVSISAAPKIKFMEGSKLRPWIIPAGLALHVVSPPSESISFWIPGVMFGAGVDYNFWKDFYIGIDGRYHLTGGKADGVKVDGMTAGAYLGIGF